MNDTEKLAVENSWPISISNSGDFIYRGRLMFRGKTKLEGIGVNDSFLDFKELLDHMLWIRTFIPASSEAIKQWHDKFIAVLDELIGDEDE